jgi:CRP/FNR family transcriptional regulator, cyclic AMP receptor protein
MASRELFGVLRQHPIWEAASDVALHTLADGARSEDRAAGQMFVIEGQPADAIWLLMSGAARVFYPQKKERPEVTVRLMRAPGAFGDVACVTKSAYTASVEALEPARAIAVDARAYFAALQQDPKACFRQYWDVALRFAGAVGTERAAFSSSVVERVVALLLAYAEHGGGDVKLSQDDIAQQVGSNRRSVVRVMEQLYDSGGLERRGRRYAIVDRAKLLSVATLEVPNLLGPSERAPWGEASVRR